MKLLVAAICDEATAEADGKLTLTGVFHDLYASGFPAKQDRLVLVLVLEWAREDRGHYDFKADLMGPDGKPTLSVQGQSQVEPRPGHRPPARTQIVMPMDDVVFPVPGEYVFQVSAKGRKFRGPALYLIEAEEADAPQPG